MVYLRIILAVVLAAWLTQEGWSTYFKINEAKWQSIERAGRVSNERI